MHDLVDRGVAYNRTHLTVHQRQVLERYRMQCINATYNGESHSEPWWQEFTKDFIKRFPSTALDQRFTSEVRYEESVDLLREKELEKWMDAHGGRIAKAYSASCKEFENCSASAHPTDVVESTETTDRTRSESGSQNDSDQSTANKQVPQ
ncbi:uncharacterized protein ARMOST_12886 [Armillaria ostoyae]|uniref:Uncharacterized protein n=1 Tax=Armillaria ostoyae TaxID=47428 RepID=A0A284RL76_ARMOS|nr:uncharacterized protein ARMOST_12886 [Armillaria ostoyae]